MVIQNCLERTISKPQYEWPSVPESAEGLKYLNFPDHYFRPWIQTTPRRKIVNPALDANELGREPVANDNPCTHPEEHEDVEEDEEVLEHTTS